MGIYLTYFSIWKKALILAWPLVLNHVFVTAMRTTDMLLMGFISPAAVAAVGLGDVWERIVLRVGLALGTGSISLISQESGADTKKAEHNSDLVLTQVLLTGGLIGLPFILIGCLIPEKMIALLGAESEVVVLAGQYLQIIFSAAPFRIMGLISARALQGTGDTRTPMIVGIISNIINIGLSFVLVLGFWFFPELGVLGVGIGTFVAKFFDALIYISIFVLPGNSLNLEFSVTDWNFTITKQLIKVATPRGLQGGYQSLITFPFNSLVLIFGTEAAAAYHIGRRIQQQLMAPLQRAYGTVTTIICGQALGRGQSDESRKAAKGILWLSVFTVGILSATLFIFAPAVVAGFSEDPLTLEYGTGFLRALLWEHRFLVFIIFLSGLLTAAGDTRTPFYGLVFSQTLFKLGLSFVLSVPLNLALLGIFMGMVIDFISQFFWVWRRFRTQKWEVEARQMIAERRQV